jgi:site-specific DNA-adenine methylase
MNNHFYMSHFGNKRNEAENFYNSIDLSQIKTIIEPFAGTSAISYFIWTKNPDLKFILNDNNKYIIEMYNIIKDDEKLIYVLFLKYQKINRVMLNLLKKIIIFLVGLYLINIII